MILNQLLNVALSSDADLGVRKDRECGVGFEREGAVKPCQKPEDAGLVARVLPA